MNDSSVLPTCRLPNGLEIHHHRQYETDFVYREVFIDQIYTQPFNHELQGRENLCIIDVGANIGLFSLFIKQTYPQAQVYAFEPSPTHIEILKKNLAPYSQVQIFQLGLGGKTQRLPFTYYPHYSILSGFHGNPTEDKKLLEAGIATQLALDAKTDEQESRRYLEFLVGDKLDDKLEIYCDITTLSTVMADQSITQIDLLKIDAEKAELDILQGIADSDWKKIHRIVVEAHGTDHHQLACSLLQEKGYQLTSNKTADFGRTAIFTIYAQLDR